MKQFILFVLIAGLAAMINIFLRFIFSNVVRLEFYLAVSFAYITGMFFNYYFNKRYNFRSGNRNFIREFNTFFIVSAIGLILVNIFSFFFLKLFSKIGVNQKYIDTLSHVLAVFLVGMYSFIAHKYLTFQDGIITGLKKYVSVSLIKAKNILR